MFFILFILSLFQPLNSSELIFAATLDQPTHACAYVGSDPNIVLEWTDVITSSGVGAFHAVGGNIVSGDADWLNSPTKRCPLGGSEVWTGAAFYFVSFPNEGLNPVWLMVTVPDNNVNGSGNKPTAMITSAGKLRLGSSNNGGVPYTESVIILETNHWYYLILHGLYGQDANQQLLIYDGEALIETLDLTLTGCCSQAKKVAKWGFGTTGDSTGLEYYFDRLCHYRGDTNPGPCWPTSDFWLGQ